MALFQSTKLNILSATRDLVHFYVLSDVTDIKLQKPALKRLDFETLCKLEIARHRRLSRKMSLASGLRENDRVFESLLQARK